MFGLKTMKLDEMIKMTGLRPEKLDFKPLPIDLANLVAYSSARALSKEEYRNKQICIDVHDRVVQCITDYWWGIDKTDRRQGLGLRRTGRDVVFYPIDGVVSDSDVDETKPS